MFIMLIILIVSWAMMVNFSKLLFERIIIQNAADNAALSGAVNQARTLNMINMYNRLISSNFYDGVPYPLGLGLGGIHPARSVMGAGGGLGTTCVLVPIAPQYLMNDVTRIASLADIYMGIIYCGFGTLSGTRMIDDGVTIMRECANMLITIQEGIAKTGPLFSFIVSQKVARRQNIGFNGIEAGADYIVIPPKAMSLGLQRNREHITYFGAFHVYASNETANVHAVLPVEVGSDDKTWYLADDSVFYRKRITVTAFKDADSSSLRGYPLLGKWLSIPRPSYAAIASAACYNRRGPGFPVDSGNGTSTDIRSVLNISEEEGASWQAHLVPVHNASIKH